VTAVVSPLRIVFVLEYFPPHVGGVETLFDHLTEGLARRGHTVSVVTLYLPGTPRREVRKGVEIIRVRTPQRARRYLFTLFSLPAVLKRAAAADIIHTTTYNAAITARLAAIVRRKPVVVTVHEVFGAQWNHLLGLRPLVGYGFRLYEWFVLHLRFTHYFCDSGFTRTRLLDLTGLPAEKASVVYPAIDYAFWDPARHRPRNVKDELGYDVGTFLYLYFGRTGISKGIEYLIDAAALVRERLEASRLVLILAKDPADQYRRLLRRIAQRGLTDYVTVLDPVPRDVLPGYLLAADCVVIPSVSEGFGYAAGEAATLGCPIIATTGHSVEEVLEGCVDFVPPRDPVALADALVAAAQQRRPGHSPRRFDMESHVAGVETIYERLVTAGRMDAVLDLLTGSMPPTDAQGETSRCM